MSIKFIMSFKFKKARNTVHKRTCIVRTVIHDFKKAMASHSSTLTWKIPWMEEPVRLQSMGSLRVRHDLSDFTFTFHFHALEKEVGTHSSVLEGRIPGTGRLVDCHLQDRTVDTTEVTLQQQQQQQHV